MIPWLTLSHVSDDVIKRNYEIKEKGMEMDSHTFGLRKEGRKLPSFWPIRLMLQKGGEKGKEKGENGEKMKRDEKRNEKKKRKAKGKNKTKEKAKRKRREEEKEMHKVLFSHFRERVSSFSLEL